MIYLELFLTFLKIGVVSFGGGYAMIPLIRETVIANGWLAEEELLNFIAVSESTPGPIAVNMATFIGSSQGGILGSALATLGIVLPSFIIILLIVSVVKNLVKFAGVKATLNGIRPAIVGLICATFITMSLSTIAGVKTFQSPVSLDFKGIIIFVILCLIMLIYSKTRKKPISPIILILISALLGIIAY